MQIKSKPFDFIKLIMSHGWVFLEPFEWSETTKYLKRYLRTPNGKSVQFKITAKNNSDYCIINVSPVNGKSLDALSKKNVHQQISRMFWLDGDFSEFYAICADDSLLNFVPKLKCGGILRCPTAFEDLVKTVCTTNCDWRNTKKMCQFLCKLGKGNFPTPGTILKYSVAALAQKVPLGYRSKTVHTIARHTTEGKLSLDEWAENGEYDKIRNRLREIWGIGSYSINHMLVLLGDYSNIPVDSEVLKYLQQMYFGGRSVSATEAVKPYERYGKYKFLAYKFTRMAKKLNYVNK